MGGMISCAAKLTDKDNSIIKFSVNTNWFYKRFNDPRNILNEKRFISKLKEYDLLYKVGYDNQLTMDEYGLIFIDFNKNKYFWINNHSALGVYDSFVFNNYKKLEKINYDVIKYGDYDSQTDTFKTEDKFKVWEKPFINHESYCFLHQSLSFASGINFKGHLIKDITHIKDFLSIIEKRKDKKSDDIGFTISDDDLSDIIIVWKDWDSFYGTTEKNDVKKLFEYLIQESLLDNQTIKIWEAYLKNI